MVISSSSSSSTPNPRFTSQCPKRPPLLPSDPPAAVPRKPKSREVTSRYLSSAATTRRSPSPVAVRTAPNTPAPDRSRSADRRRPSTPDTVRNNGLSKRSLAVSFQGEGFAVGKGAPVVVGTPAVATGNERRRNGGGDENARPGGGGGGEKRVRWPGSVTRSLDCSTPGAEKKSGINGGTGGHVARALQMQRSVDDTALSSVSGSTTASDLATSDNESVSSRRPRAIAVPARFWQETTNRLKRLPEQNSTKKFFNDSNSISSPPRMPGSRGSSSPIRGSVRPASPSKVPSALSPSRGKLSPSRVRNIAGTNDYVSSTPSVLSFAADTRRVKIGENKISDMHELKMLHNRQLQWQFANARAAAAMQTQKETAEKTIHNVWENTSTLRDSVESKRVELQQLRQQLKLYSLLKGQMPYLDDWECLDGDYSSCVAGAVESLLASTLRLPLVGGAKANIQEVKDTISSAVDVMHGIGSSICGLLEKVVQTNSLASELASISTNELSSLDQCRDLLSAVTTMQVEDCSLRTQMLQLTQINPCRSMQYECL